MKSGFYYIYSIYNFGLGYCISYFFTSAGADGRNNKMNYMEDDY